MRNRLFLIALAIIPLFASGQTTGDYRSNVPTMNWAVASNWQRWDGTAWVSNPSQGWPGQFASGIAGTVTIQAGHTVTLNTSPALAIGNLVIEASATFTSGTNTLQMMGDFVNNGGTFTPGTGTVTFNGAADQAITGTVMTQTFNAVIVNKGGGALNVSGSTVTLNTAAFTLTQGTFNSPATLNTTGTITLTAGTFNAGANINVGGTGTTNFTNNGGTFVPGSGTVTFTGSGAQAINGSLATQTFNNLIVAKTGGTLTGTAATIITSNLTLTSGTFSAGANTNVSGDFTNNGGTFTPGGNTVTFNGAGPQEINGTALTQTFNNLVVNKSGGALSIGGSTTTVTLNGSFTLSAGTFNAPANLNIAGANFANSGGTFVPGSGTVTFTGGATQQINGSPVAQSFNNLVVNKSGGTLTVGGSTTTLNIVNLTRTAGTFTAPTTVNVSGNLVLTAGAYNAGANTNIGGDFTSNGGFTPGVGNTVTFNGTGAQVINGAAASIGFTNLVINKPGSSTVTVGGSIATITVVTLNQTAGNFTAPATLTASATVTLNAGTFTAGANTNIAGDFVNNGATFVPGTGTVTFNGTVGQNINSTLATQTFNNLVVNKPGPSTLSVTGSITTLNVAAFTLSVGNFAAPATLNATGTFSLLASPGIYTAGTNTNLAGDFIVNTGSTFTAGTNTVTFNGSATKSIGGTNGTSATFHNLVVADGFLLFGTNATPRTLNISNNLSIAAGASFLSGATGTGAHTINLTGNLQNDGTIDFSANSATAHVFALLGTTKTIDGAGTTTFQSLRMNTTASANVNLNTNVRVNGALTWSAPGLLILNDRDFIFGRTATVAAPSATSYIQVDGTSAITGNVVKVNNGSTASWQFLFPVGTAVNGYSPVNLVPATITNPPTIDSRLSVKAILSPDAPGRLKRTFRLRVSGNGIATTFTNAQFNYFNPGDVSGAEPIASYNTFWYQRESTGIWTRPSGTAPGTLGPSTFFTAPTVTPQPLSSDTYFFTIGTSGAYGQTWYSYQTGNWNNPLTWTADGSSFPLYVNPAPAQVPGPADQVVIKSGHTVTMDVNNVQVNSIDVIGTLNVAATTGHNLTSISGTGRIRIAGSTDNFPAGTATNFADNVVGGTLEINGTGMLLTTPRTFNNVVINLSAASNAAVLKSNYTLNGDLTLTRGVLQFEDATAPSNRTFVVNGHVSVAVDGGIRLTNSLNRHEFNLFGDFINNGTAYFTNRTAPNVSLEADNAAEPVATRGIIDFNLLSTSRNQVVACNGETRFYRIEIDKGTDATFIASISASDVANFNLFGRADYDINGAIGSNANALGLAAGTVELGNNVTVLLNSNGNYSIRERARLWINGATVTKTGGNAVVPYGTVRVSAGTLTIAPTATSGLTMRDRGVILVEGGTVTVPQIRTSVLGMDQIGSYIQSGGDVFVNGVSVAATYAQFSLTYPGNVFNMSGGTLTVRGAFSSGSDRPSIFINSDPGNVSVTGGTVVMEVNTNNLFRVNSRAPFWNVIMRKTGGTSTQIQIPATSSISGDPGDEATLAPQPLVVLNDLTIEGATPLTFVTNNLDVTVGGNFEIQNGGTYTHGTNTTTINGPGVGSLIFGNTTTTQTFNNLTINKANATDEVVIAAGRPGPVNSALQVNGTLSITRGVFNYGNFVASARGTVNLSSGVVVGKTASTGRILLNGPSAQTLNSSNAAVHNVEINNSNNVTLASGNLTLLGTLTLTAGVFDVNIFRLTIGAATNPAANISGTGFGASKMIRLAGNASDEGLELYLDANETLNYPIGTNAGGTPRYTPVTAVFQNFSDDGFVRISLGDAELPTSNIAAGANTIISYYWRVQHTGFTTLPRVTSYTFNAQDSDDADGGATPSGLATGFVPGKVLDVNPFTRSSEVVGNISGFAITFNGNTGSGATPFTLEAANYTAGTGARFTGSPTVYYSRSAGATGFPGLNWHDGNSWSLVSHTGPAAGSFPTAGSIAVIGSGNTGANPHHSVNVTTNNAVAAELIFVPVPSGTFQARLTVQPNRNITFGRVSGPGTVMIRVNTTQQPVVVGDFGDFSLETTSQYNYTSTENAVTPIPLPTNPVVFPNLRFEGSDAGGGTERRMTIPADILVRRNINVDRSANFVLGGNVVVQNDVLFNDGTQGRIEFPTTGANLTFSIGRDLLMRTGGGTNNFVVGNGTPSSLQHRLIVGRDITMGNGNLDLFNGSGTNNNAILEIGGTDNGVYTNSAGTTPDLFRLVMNKGTSIANSFTLSNNVTLNGPFDGAVKPLQIQNGLLVLNNTGINFTLTAGGGDFNIPGSAGLEVRAGTARTTTTSVAANIILDGLLRVSGGTVDINGGSTTDSNYIQYSNSGNAAIEVTDGSLTVAGQIRRDLASATGVLRYTQSAGTVLVANESSDTNLRGVFEVLNPGSQFNHSGGSFTIVRGNGSASVPSVRLEPATSSITSGSTITIGNASTPAGTIGIQSSVALNNLAIAGLAASTPQVSLYVTPLIVNGNVTVAASNTLNALGRDLTIGGDFTVNGTYTPGANTTIFNNAGAATIGGALSTIVFNNVTKTGAGTLNLARNITINRDLRVLAGVLNTATFSANLLRHAEVDATIASTSGSGLIFGSTIQQQRLTRSASGTGTLGIVTINNSNGVIVPDGNGYDFNITNNLRLQSGVFDIGGSLLSLGVSALITPVNPYSAANLIQTNSSFTDKGVRKQFPLNYTTDFVFPVGQSNYTPVTFNFGAPGNTTGSSGAPTITIRPTNRVHPVIVDDAVGEPPVINDLNNVLQYYWIVNAANVSNTFRSNMALQYVQPLVAVTPPYSESNYIAARILTDPSVNPSLDITKLSTVEVNDATNVITFDFSSIVDQRSITGEYFAGVSQAIPNNVPTYTTNASGNVGDPIYTPTVFGGIPTGARVIVSPGHTVTFNTGSVILFQTVLNAGATITIPSGSIGHSLGALSGTGNLEINSDDVSAVLPAAEYDTFFSCAGGGLIFGGSGSYEVLGGITSLRNLTLNGTGEKSLANNNITICDDLVINDGIFRNSSNRIITVQRDVRLNAGYFDNSLGTLTISRDLVQADGTFDGGSGGTKTISRNLIVNGGTFSPGTGTTNVIRVNGNMTVAGVATITTGLGGVTGQRFTFGGSSPQVLTGDFTTTRAFNRLEINNSAGLTLAGNVTINNQLQLTNGLITPGSNTFLLTGSAIASPASGSATSFVNGRLFKTIPAAGASFEFPIGKGNRWRSGGVALGANVINAGQTWDMEYFVGPATGVTANAPSPRSNPVSNFTSSDPLVLTVSSLEYWRVSDGSGTANGRTALVRLRWGIESDVSANFAEREALKVMSWSGTEWTNNGGTSFPGGHTQANGSVLSVNFLPFSENILTFGTTEAANPLPIELTRFEVRRVGADVELFWQTASELENDYFEVQRSVDGVEYEVLGRVQGNGTSNRTHNYFFGDTQPQIGINYYRLKQVDFDGNSSYSEVRRISFDGSVRLALRVYPNPTEVSNLNFQVSGKPAVETRVRLLDLQGRVHFQKVYTDGGDVVEDTAYISSSLPAGVYLMEVVQDNQRVVDRVVIR
jgi:hypothetical protein